MKENLKREKELRAQMRKPTPYVKASSPKRAPLIIAPIIAPKKVSSTIKSPSPYVSSGQNKIPENITLTIEEPDILNLDESPYENEPIIEKTTDLSYEDDDLSYRQ